MPNVERCTDHRLSVLSGHVTSNVTRVLVFNIFPSFFPSHLLISFFIRPSINPERTSIAVHAGDHMAKTKGARDDMVESVKVMGEARCQAREESSSSKIS
jgi:hypothetical protein